jgi:hypothetical protein
MSKALFPLSRTLSISLSIQARTSRRCRSTSCLVVPWVLPAHQGGACKIRQFGNPRRLVRLGGTSITILLRPVHQLLDTLAFAPANHSILRDAQRERPYEEPHAGAQGRSRDPVDRGDVRSDAGTTCHCVCRSGTGQPLREGGGVEEAREVPEGGFAGSGCLLGCNWLVRWEALTMVKTSGCEVGRARQLSSSGQSAVHVPLAISRSPPTPDPT